MYYSHATDDDGGPVTPGAGTAAELEAALVELEAAERVRLIQEIRALEDLKGAIAAAQAGAAAAFDASTRRAQAAAGLKADQLGKGVAAEIALARRESPHHGAKLLGLARILTTEMPHTLHALSTGVISEWRATLLVRETACLSLADRQEVDRQVAGNLTELEQLGDRKLIARIKSLSYGLDPHAVINRAARAVAERFVSCRPAPDTMTYLTALLPVTQGVGVYAALTREADRLRAAGDPRTKGQIMADTFVERATGQARAEDARIEVQLIMSDQALLHGILPKDQTPASSHDAGSVDPAAGGLEAPFVPDGAEPAVLAGYGMVPAQWARDLIRGPQPGQADDAGDKSTGWGSQPPRLDPQTEVWLRRLYVTPDTRQLTAMDSRARLVPHGLARLIAARDQVCRTPWCGAPIRHYDHIKPVHAGGTTSAENIQGLCQACNQAKEAPGWEARSAPLRPVAADEACGMIQPPPDRPGPHDQSALPTQAALRDQPALPDQAAPPQPPTPTQLGAETRQPEVWLAETHPPERHTVLTRTPTGHIYRSTAPKLPSVPKPSNAFKL